MQTHTQTHRQDQLQYTVLQLASTSAQYNNLKKPIKCHRHRQIVRCTARWQKCLSCSQADLRLTVSLIIVTSCSKNNNFTHTKNRRYLS